MSLTPVLENLPKKVCSLSSSVLATMARVQIKVSITYGQILESSRENVNEHNLSHGKNLLTSSFQSKDYKDTLQTSLNIKENENNMLTEKSKPIKEDLMKMTRGKQPTKKKKNVNNIILNNKGYLPNSLIKKSIIPIEAITEKEKIKEIENKNLDISEIDEIFNDEEIYESPFKQMNNFIEILLSCYSEKYLER